MTFTAQPTLGADAGAIPTRSVYDATPLISETSAAFLFFRRLDNTCDEVPWTGNRPQLLVVQKADLASRRSELASGLPQCRRGPRSCPWHWF